MVSTRYTKILIANTGGLFPAEWLYPADDLFPVEAGVREITNIVAGSLKLDEMIAERIPQFGQLYSSKFECKIYLEDDLSGKNIAVYQEDEGVLHGVFFGKIDSCKTDRVGTDRTIVAYDPAYELREINVAQWWETFWSNNRQSATLKQVRDSLTTYLQISAEDVTLPNDNLTVTKTVSLSTCTFQQMLKMICELNCCFPHVNRNGNLDYIILNTDDTPTDLDGLYEWTASNFEEYTTTEIDGVQFFDSGDQLKYTVGNSENAYPVSKNIFLYDKSTSVLQSVGNTMLGYLEDLTYNPASIKMIISDMTFRLGDYVTAEGHNFYIFQNSISGQQFIEQTIKAKGDKQLYAGASHMEYGDFILNERISRVIANVEEFYTEYTNYAQQTTTKINQNADRIEFQAGKLSNYQGSYIPTTSNSPANTWNTDAKKEAHENEVFYNPQTGKYYKWEKTNNTWRWTETTDINVARNLSSQLSIESGKITIGTGRLEINAQNFTLDTDGNMTAKSATLENVNITSTRTSSSGRTVEMDDSEITIYYNESEIGTVGASAASHGQQHYNTLEISSTNTLLDSINEIWLNSASLYETITGRVDIFAQDQYTIHGGDAIALESGGAIVLDTQGNGDITLDGDFIHLNGPLEYNLLVFDTPTTIIAGFDVSYETVDTWEYYDVTQNFAIDLDSGYVNWDTVTIYAQDTRTVIDNMETVTAITTSD